VRPDVSVVIYTAREDYPYVDRPDLHCLEPVLRTLETQTFRYFELVVVDALYDQRPRFFEGRGTYFPIKHVPAGPNVWHSRGRPGLCAQLNRGLAWCDGSLAWIGAENNLYPPHFLQAAWDVFVQGKVPVAWYAVLGHRETPPDWKYPPVRFDMLGYTEAMIGDVDHRAQRFVEDPHTVIQFCHHQNYFAYASVPLEVAYALNGFDESLDGDLCALDVDMGSRISMLLGEDSMRMHRDLWLMEPPTVERWAPGIERREYIKCGYAIWWYNRLSGRKRVNVPHPEGWVDDVKRLVCGEACPIRERCSAGDPAINERVMYPFCESADREERDFWLSNLPVRDLARDAESRRRRERPFDRVTEFDPWR
jgi:hypothetical protein